MSTGSSSPFGTWRSPISADLLAAGELRLLAVMADGQDVYWLEQRPSEKGRAVLVKWEQDRAVDVTPAEFNVRSSVHDYGGGAFLVSDRQVYFSNYPDGRIYMQSFQQPPRSISPDSKYRFADFRLDKNRERLISVCERELQSKEEPENCLVAIELSANSEPRVLVSGADFYSSPRISPDGKQLAWISWNHPNMPWDGTELWIASIKVDGGLSGARKIAGGLRESIVQPEWSADGSLYYVSDSSGWWNIYRYLDGTARNLTPLKAEFARPAWGFNFSAYALANNDTLICSSVENGRWNLGKVDLVNDVFHRLETPFSHIFDVRTTADKACFLAGSPEMATAVVSYDLESGSIKVIKNSVELDVDRKYFSVPEQIEFPTSDEKTAFAYYYAPKNVDFSGTAGELPPLIVMSHGGPTGASSDVLNLQTQFWTSRGFAVVDVDYGGSTGYGRAYRERINRRWGEVDVDDCCNAALYLVARGVVDSERLIIRGGSAGGYTTLCALTFRDIFKAGGCRYAVSDLEALALHTIKFESKYHFSLVGNYPEEREIYQARSPINHVQKLKAPVIFLQGSEDKVVAPPQSELMHKALIEKGIYSEYILFEGEGHGFKKAETIRRAFQAELEFYLKVFKLQSKNC